MTILMYLNSFAAMAVFFSMVVALLVFLIRAGVRFTRRLAQDAPKKTQPRPSRALSLWDPAHPDI